jgi:hypothetical protein
MGNNNPNLDKPVFVAESGFQVTSITLATSNPQPVTILKAIIKVKYFGKK